MALFSAKLDKGIKQIGRKAMRDALRDSLRMVGRYWQRYFLPLHFTKAAYRRYGYTPRQGDPGSGRAFIGSYQWRKLKGFKNDEGIPSAKTTKPLVFTGRSMATGLRGNVTPRAQSAERGYVDITVPAPALNFPGRNKKLNMREEVTAVTPAEEQKLQELMVRDIEKRITRTLARA